MGMMGIHRSLPRVYGFADASAWGYPIASSHRSAEDMGDAAFMPHTIIAVLAALFAVSVIANAVVRHHRGECSGLAEFALGYMPLLMAALMSTLTIDRPGLSSWGMASLLLTIASLAWFVLAPLSEFTGIRHEIGMRHRGADR